MYICSFPALFNGESNNVRRHCPVSTDPKRAATPPQSWEASFWERDLYLMCDIWSCFTYIPPHPPKRTLMIITIQKLILSLPLISRSSRFINFQTRLFQYNI